MALQVLHEAEHTRQHARYKIPAKIMINSKQYELENWSVGGLSIENIEDTEEKFFQADLIFDFGTFSTMLNVNLEKKVYKEDIKTLGCSFYDLSKDKLSVLHYILNAYLAGELATTGSLIEVLKKDRFTSKDMSKVLNPDMTFVEKFTLRTRQIITYILLTTVVFGLIGFISYSTYNKLFVVKSLSAIVDAPMVVIRSPQPSYYTAINHKLGAEIKNGDLIASMKLIGGGVNSIESPTQGKVIIENALNNSFVDKGEPLLSILPTNTKLYIEAKVKISNVSKLIVGQEGIAKLSNAKEIKLRLKAIKSASSVVNLHANPLQTIPTASMEYVVVVLEPIEDLGVEHLGEVVSVKIDTFSTK